jgi:hypothetical protein
MVSPVWHDRGETIKGPHKKAASTGRERITSAVLGYDVPMQPLLAVTAPLSVRTECSLRLYLLKASQLLALRKPYGLRAQPSECLGYRAPRVPQNSNVGNPTNEVKFVITARPRRHLSVTERRKRSRLIGVHRMTSAKPKSYQKAPTVRSERKRYFFDIRDGDEIAVDEEGMILATVQAVQEEAARSLAGIAQDAVCGSASQGIGHHMAIEVRDEAGPVLQATFTFAVERHKH